MELRLPASVSSPQDLTALLLEIQGYARWFAHESIKQRVHAKHASEPPLMTKAAEDLLRNWSGDKHLTPAMIDGLVKSLEHHRATAPSITITLPAPPTGSIKADLVTWCRENITPNVLINFQFNSTLLGGMVVRSGSHVFDWSFRRKILDNRQKFPEVLRSV